MRPFGELVHEAELADVTGWGFDWLDWRDPRWLVRVV